MADWRTAELLATRSSSDQASDYSWSGQSLEHNTSQGPFFFGAPTCNTPPSRPRAASGLSDGVIRDHEFCQPQREHWQSVQARRVVRHLARDVVGAHASIATPFGARALSYADFAATNRALHCIEGFLLQALPLYGSVRASGSATGLQSAQYQHEAREILVQSVNARVSGPGAHDRVLFTGQARYDAVVKLVAILGLHTGKRPRRAGKRPVVFTDASTCPPRLYEWLASGVADVVVVPEASDGYGLDVSVLERQLRLHARRPLRIGLFSASSGLTGVLTDVDAVSTLLHRYDALACWDYIACAPYVAVDMNPPSAAAYKDAVFFSGHQFLGGPGSPGVLVLKKRLLIDTEAVTTSRTAQYPDETLELLGCLRLALAVQLQQRVGIQHIRELQRHHAQHVRYSLARNSHIELLGPPSRGSEDEDRLPVFCFLVRLGDRFLHFRFVCALLNDLFGVQTSDGGPDADAQVVRLLGIARHDALALQQTLQVEKKEVLRPGFTRVSLPYFMDKAEVNYVLAAVDFVATHGWKFLPQYDFDSHSGVWQHFLRADVAFPGLQRLEDFSIEDEHAAGESVTRLPDVDERDVAAHRQANLGLAASLADQSIETAAEPTTVASDSSYCSGVETITDTDDELRWFVLPSEAVASWRQLRRKPPLTAEILGPCQSQRYSTGGLQTQWHDALGGSRRARNSGFLASVRRFVRNASPTREAGASQGGPRLASRRKQRAKWS